MHLDHAGRQGPPKRRLLLRIARLRLNDQCGRSAVRPLFNLNWPTTETAAFGNLERIADTDRSQGGRFTMLQLRRHAECAQPWTPFCNEACKAVSWLLAPSCGNALCSSGLLSRSFEYQLRNFFGMGDQREVAGLHLDGLGAHPLGHEALEVRIDGTILR
jgi:hypothetical protein